MSRERQTEYLRETVRVSAFRRGERFGPLRWAGEVETELLVLGETSCQRRRTARNASSEGT
jgi:hypothetical protein